MWYLTKTPNGWRRPPSFAFERCDIILPKADRQVPSPHLTPNVCTQVLSTLNHRTSIPIAHTKPPPIVVAPYERLGLIFVIFNVETTWVQTFGVKWGEGTWRSALGKMISHLSKAKLGGLLHPLGVLVRLTYPMQTGAGICWYLTYTWTVFDIAKDRMDKPVFLQDFH
jgi:hypothetical protein